MKESLQKRCKTFLVYRDTVKSALPWENSYLYPVCANIFLDAGKQPTVERIQACKKLFKEQTGVFSAFRSTGEAAMISMLAADEQPEARMERTKKLYSALREHFFSSQYLAMISTLLAGTEPEERFPEIAVRTRRIYDEMKRRHPLLTSEEDGAFAAFLAVSPLSDEQIAFEVEQCYQRLKAFFFSANAVQSLSHVLTLCAGDPVEKCDKVISLFRSLQERGLRYGTYYELSTLGVLALLPMAQEGILREIEEADAFLKEQKGYGFFGVGRKMRLMHAAMLVSGDSLAETDSVMQSAALGGTVSQIVAEQTALCCAVAASTAAAVAASSAST